MNRGISGDFPRKGDNLLEIRALKQFVLRGRIKVQRQYVFQQGDIRKSLIADAVDSGRCRQSSGRGAICKRHQSQR